MMRDYNPAAVIATNAIAYEEENGVSYSDNQPAVYLENVEESTSTVAEIVLTREEQLQYYLEHIENGTIELTEELSLFFQENYIYFGVNPGYIFRLYTYRQDYVFWLQTMALGYNEVAGNRNHQLLITRRILELNDNPNDRWIGIGFSTLRNGYSYLEQDFRVHTYSIGIIGAVLLLGPYIAILLKASFVVLVNYKKKFNIENIIFMISIAIAIATSWMSGNVMDELVVTIFIGLIAAMLLLNLKEKE